MRSGWLLAVLVLVAVAGAQEGTVVYRDDFEGPATTSPPPGWVMWGAQEWKDPANYTRDTTNPHSGQACFRIHHPAKTSGYIVSDPKQALRPKPQRIYTLRFWARAARAGRSAVSWVAYETVAPMKDAPWPGSLAFDVTPAWREYTYTIREGLDFRAAVSAYLMLGFYATRIAGEEQTLWVDDLTVTERPDPHAVQLPDETKLTVPRLDHVFTPGGPGLEATVDAAKTVRPATVMAGGISFHRVVGWTGQPYNRKGEYTLDPRLETAIRELHLPMTRFYGVGDEPFSVQDSLDKLVAVCRKTGIALPTVVVELEDQGANRPIPPATWAAAARYSLDKGYGFRYWEIGNEVYSSTWGHPDMGHAYPTSDAYIEHLKAVSAAIKAVQPDAQIGVSVGTSLAWNEYVQARAAGSFDYVVHHYYDGPQQIMQRKFEVVALTENYALLQKVLHDNAVMVACSPNHPVYSLDTEWGLSSSLGKEADYVDRNANAWGTLHRAVRLIYYAREGMLRGASSWQMFSAVNAPGFGVLSQQAPDQQFQIYWLYREFNRHVGDRVLAFTGTAPFYTPAAGDDPRAPVGKDGGPVTPMLVTADAAGAVHVVVANGSRDGDVPCRIRLQNAPCTAAKASLLRVADVDAPALVPKGQTPVSDLPVTFADGTLSFTLPSHGVAFVTLTR